MIALWQTDAYFCPCDGRQVFPGDRLRLGVPNENTALLAQFFFRQFDRLAPRALRRVSFAQTRRRAAVFEPNHGFMRAALREPLVPRQSLGEFLGEKKLAGLFELVLEVSS